MAWIFGRQVNDKYGLICNAMLRAVKDDAQMVLQHAKQIQGQAQRWPLDPRVWEALAQMPWPIPPDVLKLVAMEWPHASEGEGRAKIAYTQSPEKWAADRQTICRPGAYIARVFPELSGRQVELIVTTHSPKSMELVTDADQMIRIIRSVKSGSCMGGEKFDDNCYHPMRVYAPELGWSLAVRYEGGDPVGRCLVYDFDGAERWVRSYCNSGSDHALEDWLTAQGIEQRDSWRGAKLLKITSDDGIVAPYLDGDERGVDDKGDHLRIGGDDYKLDQTCGYVDDHRGQVQDAYGNWIDESDAVIVDGEWVHENNATYIESIGEYVMSGDAVYCETTRRDELLSDCTELYNGDWVLDREAVEITDGPHRGDHALDEDVVETHDGETALKEDCVELENGDWAVRDDCVEFEGDWYLERDTVTVTHGSYKGQVVPEELTLRFEGGYCHEDDADRVSVDGEWQPRRLVRRGMSIAKLTFGQALRADLTVRKTKVWEPEEQAGFRVGDRVERITRENTRFVPVGMRGTVTGFARGFVCVHWDGLKEGHVGSNNYDYYLRKIVEYVTYAGVRVGDVVRGPSNLCDLGDIRELNWAGVVTQIDAKYATFRVERPDTYECRWMQRDATFELLGRRAVTHA